MNWDASKTSEGISGTLSGYSFAVGKSGYDAEDRLVNWARSDNNLDQSWIVSLVGDWNSITENATTQNRTHGPTHEMLTAAGASVTHDAKGNVTSIPAVLRATSDPLSMTWDFDNRLVSADVDNGSTAEVIYNWDALSRRELRDNGTTATVFVQSGQQTIADYTSGTAASNPTHTYVYASYIDEPVMRGGTGGLRYYHRNQQYSITALTDGGGTIKARYAYTAYGTPTILDAAGTTLTTSAENNRYTYTGREYDETLSLYHYRARMYDSVAGRFCSRDPIGFEGSEWSLMEYVQGRTTTLIDPFGKDIYGMPDELLHPTKPPAIQPVYPGIPGPYNNPFTPPTTYPFPIPPQHPSILPFSPNGPQFEPIVEWPKSEDNRNCHAYAFGDPVWIAEPLVAIQNTGVLPQGANPKPGDILIYIDDKNGNVKVDDDIEVSHSEAG